MKGDFTRDTFDPLKHFTRVLMQQGRVQLDSDWNEQTAIVLHSLRALAADLIGPFGGPSNNFGFQIFTAAEKDADPNLGGWKIGSAEASEETRLTEAGILPLRGDLLIGKGHYYVGGLLCESSDYVRYTQQADAPGRNILNVDEKGFYLAYLDVWEHLVTYLEDDSIREVALGGPDTAARARIVWQVKTWFAKTDKANPEITDSTTPKDIIDGWGEWVERFEPKHRGGLRAQAKVPAAADASNPCLTPPDARYRGAENQLYRVEIQNGGEKDTATFKWSRENGSVVFPVIEYSREAVRLAHLGRDRQRGLKVGDWVEIFNNELILGGSAPPLFQVDSIEPVDSTIRLRAPGQPTQFDPKKDTPLLLRRWDHKGDPKLDGAVKLAAAKETDWLALEDGVQIQFQKDGVYRTGDYWLIPARTATGDVEWPKDDKGNPLARPPHGVEHHYAPLAIIGIGGGKITKYVDCRSKIKPLVGVP